jgi:hypothetical protein
MGFWIHFDSISKYVWKRGTWNFLMGFKISFESFCKSVQRKGVFVRVDSLHWILMEVTLALRETFQNKNGLFSYSSSTEVIIKKDYFHSQYKLWYLKRREWKERERWRKKEREVVIGLPSSAEVIIKKSLFWARRGMSVEVAGEFLIMLSTCWEILAR